MRLIQLARKDTPEAKAKLLRELKEAYADERNATLIKVLPHPDDDDDQEVQAVIVPNHSAFSTLFKKVSKSNETKKSDFHWNDHELESLLGLSAMQVNFQKGCNLLLVDTEKKGQIIFAVVTREYFDSNC